MTFSEEFAVAVVHHLMQMKVSFDLTFKDGRCVINTNDPAELLTASIMAKRSPR
jgi:thymidine phosphorylase